MRRCPVYLSILALVPLLLGPLSSGRPAAGTAGAQEAAGANILRVGWDGVLEPLDPQRSNNFYAVTVSGLDYEGLTRIDEEMNTVPGAAESWAFSDDGLVLTFTLRQNLTYADGSPLVAERFRYAVERACDPKTGGGLAIGLFAIAGCEAFATSLGGTQTESAGTTPPTAEDQVAYEAARANLGVRVLDERTLEIRLAQPAAYLPALASTAVFSPVKQEAVEADPEGWWRDPAARVGNGPFRLVAVEDDQAISRIRFAANERYWGGRPRLDGFEYLYFFSSGHTSDAVEAYRRGEVDIAFPWEDQMPAIESDPVLSADLQWSLVAETAHMPFTLTQEPFQDRKVREAFAYAFDRAAWCREINFGDCVPAHSWIPPGSPGHIETDAFAFDPEQARQALAESSYGGPENLPEVVWWYPEDSSEELRDAEWLAAQYREVLGVELKLVPLSEEEQAAIVWTDPEKRPMLDWRFWYQEYPDPHNWLSVYWTCGSPFHAERVGYCNPAFDELVHRADAELDPVKRLALYEEAQRLLIADVPTVFLYYQGLSMLIKPHVVGYVITPADIGFPGWYTMMTIDIEPVA